MGSYAAQGIGPDPAGLAPPGPYAWGGADQIGYIPPGFIGQYKEPFSYNVNFLGIAGLSGVIQGTTNVQNDSWFVCTSQTVVIVDSATHNTTFTAPNVAAMLVRVADSSSGKFMMDQQTPIANIFGTALQPFIWLWRARLYRPGGQIQVELQNNMAAAQDVRFTFTGFKCYAVPDSAAQM
jgi:hypothetical protein